jgi:hypothetical protein
MGNELDASQPLSGDAFHEIASAEAFMRNLTESQVILLL